MAKVIIWGQFFALNWWLVRTNKQICFINMTGCFYMHVEERKETESFIVKQKKNKMFQKCAH